MWAERFRVARAVVVRGVGGCALVAFASLAAQLRGLVGAHGILPAQAFFERVADRLDLVERVTRLPSLFWLTGASDGWLLAFCAAGMIASALAVADVFAGPALLVAYALYLSLCGAGQIFLGYQWDMLLCESLIVAALMSPRRPSPFSLVLVWALAARLEMGSGLSKLLSGDESWRSLTALHFHFETQPLPTPVGWLAHHLPAPLLDLSCLLMFVIQLGLPPLLFVPLRKVRHAAVAGMTLLQAVIALTGNFAFFNALTTVLALAAVDDDAWRSLARALLPASASSGSSSPPAAAARAPVARAGAGRAAVAVLSCVLIVLGLLAETERLVRAPLPFDDVMMRVEPFLVAGGYGLFASMTTERDEIVVEGTLDGETWLPYAFKDKPGDVDALPGFVAPHQPRLDWQMWFAALGSPRRSPWFFRFLERLRDAEPSVLALLAGDPFHGARPLDVRATLWRYHVAPLGSGHVWTREELGVFGAR